MAKIKGKVLIIEDDQDVLFTARMILRQRFETVHSALSPSEVIDRLEKEHYDVILLDMNFTVGATSGKEGLEWLRKIMQKAPESHVIMNTAYADIQLAVDAMKEGAIDFIVKPWEHEKLLASVTAVYKLSVSKREVEQLRSREQLFNEDAERKFGEIISVSKSMEKVFETIKKVAGTDANVLILGENGTGKELIARAIHKASLRAKEAFVTVDLGAVSETLFESELFGHKKGAFTDAKEDRAGRFEVAQGGTLFLDEIGNLSMPLQAKLLTALQNRKVRRVGANKETDIDIRLICATNMPLYEMVHDNTFRQDLLYRINTVEINLPPLRERTEDIEPLAEHFLKSYAKKYNREAVGLSRDALKKLQSYPFPGNIRELQHAVERAVIMSDSKSLKPTDFLLSSHESRPTEQQESFNLEEVERVAIVNAIRKHEGNMSKAAKELGLSRTTLYRRMAKYDL